MDHFLEETEEMEYMNDSFERDVWFFIIGKYNVTILLYLLSSNWHTVRYLGGGVHGYSNIYYVFNFICFPYYVIHQSIIIL